jgi:hypothetical protein
MHLRSIIIIIFMVSIALIRREIHCFIYTVKNHVKNIIIIIIIILMDNYSNRITFCVFLMES